MEKQQFDFEAFKKEAIEQLKKGKKINGSDGVFQPLLKHFLEAALEAEIDTHLTKDERKSGNRKNGKSSKLVKSATGEFELQTPRDRQGTFEPQMVTKRQVIITDELEAKVMRLYSKGMSYEQIVDDIEELYGFTLSSATLSGITVNTYGVKELLGIYTADSEGAKFWMQVMEDLKRRGVQDVLIACIDNLKGFAEAIELVFPKTQVQSCIVHQIRNSFKYVSYKDSRAFMTDLKRVYQASSKEEAEQNLVSLEEKWNKKYPVAIQSWQNNWHRLSTYFDYPDGIRKMMYTTNTIEAFHRQVRKVTKTKGAFTSDAALLKLVYLATVRVVEKWSAIIHNWAIIASQLQIIFKDRINVQFNRLYQ